MNKMYLVAFVMISLLSLGKCEIEEILFESIVASASEEVSYPSHYNSYITKLKGKTHKKWGIVLETNLDAMLGYDIPVEVVNKVKELKFIGDNVVETFEQSSGTFKPAKASQYIGAAYRQGKNIHFAVISGTVRGTIRQKRRIVYKHQQIKRCSPKGCPRREPEKINEEKMISTLIAKARKQIQKTVGHKRD